MTEEREAWRIVIILMIISLVLGGPGAIVIGVLTVPIQGSFSWSSAIGSSLATSYIVGALVAAPLVGVLVDRWGPSRIMALGTLASAAALISIGCAQNLFECLVGAGFLGVSYLAGFLVTVPLAGAALPSRISKLGTGLIWGAVSVGAATSSIILGRAADRLGWRSAINGLGLILLGVAIFTMIASRYTARSPAPDRRRPLQKGLLQPLKSRRIRSEFAKMVCIVALFSFGSSAIYYHAVAVFVTAGLSLSGASVIFGLSWVLSALGSLAMGWVLSVYDARSVLIASTAISAIGIACLPLAGPSAGGWVWMTAFIVLWGVPANCVSQLFPLLIAEGIEESARGRLLGILNFFGNLAGAGAPILAGKLYDLTGGYHIAIIASASMTLMSVGFAWTLSMPSRPHPLGSADGSYEGSTRSE